MTTTLVLGGARSGKSRYAEGLSRGEKFYIATAEVFDNEMRKRIELHKQQRGQNWETFETPLDVVDMLLQIDGKGRFILIDCITFWISNMMHAKRDVRHEVARLGEALSKVKATVAIVSNEVGQGIVPDNKLARAFRDEQGFANQYLASICSDVVVVMAGLPMILKRGKRRSKPSGKA